jgi:CHAT domain-containing protein/tetratricopeptide (TPR) repeat protein
MLRSVVTILLGAAAVAGCATVPAPERVAELRALEAESAARLAGEGEVLFGADAFKQTGWEYCARAMNLIERGELRLGIREASKSLFLGQQSGDQWLMAAAKRDLAYAYDLAGYLDRAVQFADEALGHAAAAGDVPVDTRVVYGPAYKIRGDARLRQGRVDEALADYQQALGRSQPVFQPFVRVSLANAHLARRDFARARALFEAAETGATPTVRMLIQRGRGRLALAEGRLADAAVAFTEAARQASGPDAEYHRVWALDGLARARRAAGDRDGALAAYGEALAAAERVRARFRSEEFKTGFFGDMQQIFDGAVTLLMEAGRPEAALEASERSRARALLDLVRGRVKTSAGAEAVADPLSRTLSAAALRAALPAGTALVAYHVTAERTFAWVVRRDGISAATLEVGQPALAAEVRGLTEAIRSRSEAAVARAATLHGRLVRPLGLAPGEALIVVPHDVLHHLPFQALRSPAGWLVQERAVSYAPSASVLAHLAARPARERRRVLALGNPDLGSARLALPGSQREAEALRAVYDGAEVYVLKEATKERLLARAPQSQVLHVGAHAEVDEVDPLYSVIRLARSARVPGELEAHEIYRVDLGGSALVALSACETGLGRVSRGDEPWGFTRPILSAGAPAMLVSLWPVEDAATARLMGRFYRELAGGAARDALRAAEREVLDDPRTSHPFFWAPFVLVGDWR